MQDLFLHYKGCQVLDCITLVGRAGIPWPSEVHIWHYTLCPLNVLFALWDLTLCDGLLCTQALNKCQEWVGYVFLVNDFRLILVLK